jgi:integrase
MSLGSCYMLALIMRGMAVTYSTSDTLRSPFEPPSDQKGHRRAVQFYIEKWPLSRDWRRVVAAKKLPRISFHALRHTHTSMLIAAGVDILTISRRLGHSKASVSLDTYGHLIKGADAAAAEAIATLLR